MNVDIKKIVERQFAQNARLEEVHICSNGAVYRNLSDAEAFQKIFDANEKVVTIKRTANKSAANTKTVEDLTAEIEALEEKIKTLNGAAKTNAEKKLAALQADLNNLEQV
jgi:predicted RNA-binding Zn ribbon-like protein